MSTEENIPIPSGSLMLEGKLHKGESRVAAVVMHPHPQYGGDMDNHVVVAVCEALREVSATTLRFNFRGTGRSEGAYDGGQGELEDARAALRELRERAPHAKAVLVGYSFGAMIAAAAAQTADLDGMVLISPPLGMTEIQPFPEDVPVLVVTGDQDPISPAAAVRELAAPTVDVLVVPGADHGWWPGVEAAASATVSFAQ